MSLENFEEAYQEGYDTVTHADFARHIVEDFEYLPAVPKWISRHIDYDGIWESALSDDYTEKEGYYFQNPRDGEVFYIP
jgi:hypothetical protein